MNHFLPPDERSVFFQESKKYHSESAANVKQREQQEAYARQQQQLSQQQRQPEFSVPVEQIIFKNGVHLDPTPNAVSALITGIVSVLSSLFWLWWYGTILGIITAYITLYLCSSGMQMLKTSPHVFSTRGVGSLLTAKILAIISLAIAGISFITLVLYFNYSSQ